MPADRLSHRLGSPPLADHAADPVGEEGGSVTVHSRCGRGARRTDWATGAGRGRAAVVDDLAPEVHRQRPVRIQQANEALVRGIARGEDVARKQDRISNAQSRRVARAERRVEDTRWTH